MAKIAASKKPSLVPMTFRVPPKVRANLERKAKESGLSVEAVGTLLLDWERQEQAVKKIVQKKVEEYGRNIEPWYSFMEESLTEREYTAHLLCDLLQIPYQEFAMFKKQRKKKVVH